MPTGQEEAARAFYAGLLGLSEIPKPAALQARGGVWFSLAEGLQLHLGVETPFQPARKAHPAFRVPDLDSLSQKLGEVQWDNAIEGVQRFYAQDPFGNRLEFLR